MLERGRAQGRPNLFEGALRSGKEIGAGQRLKKLPPQVERSGLFEGETQLRDARVAGELPMLSPALADDFDQRKAHFFKQFQIAPDGLIAHARAFDELAHRGLTVWGRQER